VAEAKDFVVEVKVKEVVVLGMEIVVKTITAGVVAVDATTVEAEVEEEAMAEVEDIILIIILPIALKESPVAQPIVSKPPSPKHPRPILPNKK